MKRLTLAVLFVLATPALALEPQPDSVFVRVVDVGAGLCCVVKMPDDRYMVYDAGNFQDRGRSALHDIGELIPPGSHIDLLVLSHTDSDHVAAVKQI